MQALLVVLICVTAILCAAWLIADVLLRHWPGRQDLAWRAALVLVAGVPVAAAIGTALPDLGLHLSVLSPEAPPTEPFIQPQPPNRRNAQFGLDNVDHESREPRREVIASSESVYASQPTTASQSGTVTQIAKPTSLSPMERRPKPSRLMPIALLVTVIVWIGGTLWSLGSLAIGALRLRSMVRKSTALDSRWQQRLELASAAVGLKRTIRARQCDGIDSPLVVGVLKPLVLWPARHAHASDERSLQEMLMHEASHVARGDQWTNLLLQFVASLWWPHPLVHWMRTRITWLREILCDASVARLADRTHYAETLLNVARESTPRQARIGQLAIEPPAGTLEARITNVLRHDANRNALPTTATSRTAWLTVVALLAIAAAVRLVPARGADPKPGAESRNGVASSAPNRDDVQVANEAGPGRQDGQIVSGRVAMPDGERPARRAAVYLLRLPEEDYFILPTKPQKTTADVNGAFTFHNVQPGRFRIWAETDSLTSLQKKLGGRSLTIKNSETSESVTLGLHEGCNYEVAVRSATSGEPIANAEISFGWTDIVRMYRTGADGIARIGGLPVGDWYFVIRADGHAVQYKKTPEQELGSTTRLMFELEPGARITGSVVDSAGQAVQGVRIVAVSDNVSMAPNLADSITDENGRYELPNIPIGQAVRLGGDIEGFEDYRAVVAVAPDQTILQHKIVMERRDYAGDCLFAVVDENGNPIVGARLANYGNSTADIREGVTDKHGECLLKNLYNSHRGVVVTARADGYMARQFSVRPVGEPPKQILTLNKGKRIVGRLVKPDGEPAVNVRVYFNQGERGFSLGGKVVTDKDGLFEIDGLPDQSTFTIYTPRGFAPINDLPLPVGGKEIVEVKLKPESVIIVRAVDAQTGERIPEYNVRVGFSYERRLDDPSMSLLTSLSNPGENVLGTKKEFRLGQLPAGMPLQVKVSAEGYDAKTIPRVEAVPVDRAKPLVVKLERSDPSKRQTVAGRLRSDQRQAVAGATLRLIVGTEDPQKGTWRFYHWDNLRSGGIDDSPQCVQFLSTTTDASGRFEFHNVQDAPWLEIYHTGGGVAPGRQPGLRSTFRDLSNVELQAAAGGSVTIKVDSSKWTNTHMVKISALGWIDSMTAAFSYDLKQLEPNDSQIRFEHLPPGHYRVSLVEKRVNRDSSSFTTRPVQSESLQIEAGKNVEVAFDSK